MNKRIKITESQYRFIIDNKHLLSEGLLYKRRLRLGVIGDDVTELQQRLKDLGYGDLLGTSGPNEDGVDGKYGSSTRKAVKKFQEKEGFPGKKRYTNGVDQWDGVAGELTIDKLNDGGWQGSGTNDNTESGGWFSDIKKRGTDIIKQRLEEKNKKYLSTSKLTKSPFSNKRQGDKFRKWLNDHYKKIAEGEKLDPPGDNTSYDNSYIINALNRVLSYGIKTDKSGEKIRIFDYYKVRNPNWNDVDVGGGIEVSDNINPEFKNQIDFQDLSVSDTTNKICKPNDIHCAQFVNDFSDKFDEVGNAWLAYRNDTKLGPTISSKFQGLDKSKQDKAIELWQQIHKAGGAENESNITNGEVKTFIKELVGSGLSLNLQLDDVVGIYWRGSSHHEEAFYKGGKPWFVDGKPGNTIRKGNGWGMNTHVGIVGAIKDGVPLVFHNVDGDVRSDPAKNLRIAWVKRK